MAVITPCFPSMSLTHLTVCILLCCSLSILIKPELNDQQWLGAGAHPSQHVAEERPPEAFIYVLTLTNTPERTFLSPVKANLLSEVEDSIYGCKSLLLISDTQAVMYSIRLDAAGIFTEEVSYLKKCD